MTFQLLHSELLESEFKALKDQIEARDSFLNGRPEFNGLNNQKDVAEIRRDRVAIEKLILPFETWC